MKKLPCPYCAEKYDKDKMVKHLEKEHDDEIPLSFTSYRVVYDLFNNKPDHCGTCVICHGKTAWDEKKQKYKRLCDNDECFKEFRRRFQANMIKVYNKPSLMQDMEHQEKMLANRSISGKYTWSDGKIFTYTGKYEKNLMEFLDKTLEYKSNEILAPGPILSFTFDGKEKHWITDFLIIPYNLIIEVKDGGNNPNQKFMPITRAKTLAKEKMITSAGTFNYLRLTDNNFGQLLSILAELKQQVNENISSPIYRIHENLYPNMDAMVPLYELAYDVTDSFYHYLNEYYSNYPLYTIKTDYRLIDNPTDEVEILECVNITPCIKNKQSINQFTNLVEQMSSLLSEKYIHHGKVISYFYNNPDNLLDGCTFGVISTSV